MRGSSTWQRFSAANYRYQVWNAKWMPRIFAVILILIVSENIYGDWRDGSAFNWQRLIVAAAVLVFLSTLGWSAKKFLNVMGPPSKPIHSPSPRPPSRAPASPAGSKKESGTPDQVQGDDLRRSS